MVKSEINERCQQFLSSDEKVTLANSFTRLSRAKELYAELVLAANSSDIEALVLLVQLAKIARDPDAVIRHCDSLDALLEKRRYFAAQEKGKVLCSRGELSAGLTLLRSIPPAKRTKHVNAVIASAEASIKNTAAGKLVRDVLKETRRGKASVQARAEAIANVEDCIGPLKIDRSLWRIMQVVDASTKEAPKLHAPDASPLFCSGFGWSGSGAIFDFLSDYAPEHFAIGSDVEIRLLRSGTYGLPKLHRVIAETPKRKIAALSEFLLKGILGLQDGTEDPLEIKQISEKSIAGILGKKLTPKFVAGLDRQIVEFMDVYMDEQSVTESVQEAFSRLFFAIMNPRGAVENRPLLLNNAVLAKAPEVAIFFSGMKMVGSIRDPRDIYTTRAIQGGWKGSAEDFIELLRDGLARFTAFQELLPEQVKLMQFETFISDEKERQALLEWTGSPGGAKTGSLFDPSQSEKNIGIHRTFPDADAIRLIGEAFPDLCFKGSSRSSHIV